ncbi:MAG: ATP-binding protein [Polaromonas sp.]|uniref:sensor histidine kinase n=1 Tax=Polaromonas sp. TaxID=1869339 RepID=UPI00272F7DF8|nr:ATP-binding protein [Polaromonas sp.]MDP2450519.1 ATP-binding protein [Polaromonas sp.]MDP3247442.1 ATP-binding protein [Polaromonas sp.]MDP3755509.1 ATP-binding protein [Polaromonas sp.]
MSLRALPEGLVPPHAKRVHRGASPARPESSNPGPLQRGFSSATLAGALRLALLLWLTHFLVSMGLDFKAGSPHTAYVAHLGVQFLLLSAACFLFTMVHVPSARIYWVLGVQALAGATALYYNGNANGAEVPVPWMVMNLLSAMLLTIAMAACVYLPRSSPGWLALAGGMLGLGICIQQVTLADATEDSAVLFRHFYVLLLLVVWQLVTRRGRLRLLDTGDSPRAGGSQETGATASAVRHERRRIARDLHDGVASQIVSILSSLDHRAPEQQALGLALEQCLLDIKLTVDGIESEDQNIVEALGSLRYRVQRPLDKLGIHMVWDVEMCSALETVRGEEARQVLRIAQECLSNVMRHAQASRVVVSCRYAADMGCMEFEVRDNGVGIAHNMASEAIGKGLENMRQRARLMGGELTISSKFGSGTRVQLTLPLDPELCAVPVGPADVN